MAWLLDVISDLAGFVFVRKVDYYKHLCITLGFPNWSAPIVYLIGSGVFSDNNKVEGLQNKETTTKKSTQKNNKNTKF